MGRDCSVFVFPPGRHPRWRTLDRLEYFHGLDGALDMEYLGLYWVPAPELISAISSLPEFECAGRPDIEERAKFWRMKACDFLQNATLRFGHDVPSMILDEEYNPRDHCPHRLLERIDRMRGHMTRSKLAIQEGKDQNGYDMVKAWLVENNLRSITGRDKIPLPDFAATFHKSK